MKSIRRYLKTNTVSSLIFLYWMYYSIWDRREFPFSKNHEREYPFHIKKILGVREFPSATGRNHTICTERERYACFIAHRWRKIHLLSGSRNSPGRYLHRHFSVDRLNE